MLYTGRSTPVSSSGSGMTLTNATSNSTGISASKNVSSIKQSSSGSLPSKNTNVNNTQQVFSQSAEDTRNSILDWLRRVGSKVRDYLTSSVESSENPLQNLEYENEESETRWTLAKGITKQSLRTKAHRFVHQIAESMQGDHSNLNEKGLLPAKEIFRKLDSNLATAAKKAMEIFQNNLGKLNADEKDLFARVRYLEDQMWRKSKVPNAKMPFAFTDESLKKEYARFKQIVENTPKVKAAIEAEENANKEISSEFVKYAKILGYELPDVFSNPHYFRHVVLEYTDFQALTKPGSRGKKPKKFSYRDVKKNKSGDTAVAAGMSEILDRDYMKSYKGSDKDISSNYVLANYEVRTQMLMDIETMKAMVELKQLYDKSPEYKEKLKEAMFGQNDGKDGKDGKKFNQGEGINLSELIPEGYDLYNPAGSGLVMMANSTADNVMAAAINQASTENGRASR